MKVNTLTLEDSTYPNRLASIPTAPKKLHYIGNKKLLEAPHTLTVVGSRKVTSYGKQVTIDLVQEVASRGVVIVSGLALGVDALAHQAALNVTGKTIAVMPAGLDMIYPASHRNLAIRILENDGLLVSEYGLGTPALKQHFIARNRIVSGLGDGVLITEANQQSGTIHTANFALEQGKAVMAVPGNITSPQSAGTNSLIQTGAAAVVTPRDIFETLGVVYETDPNIEVFGANAQESLLLGLLKNGTTDSSELLALSSLDPQTFNQTLTMLEITKKVRPLGNDKWSLR